MINRNRCCPQCNSQLLARENDNIICLESNCNWKVVSKRDTDKDIQNVNELIDNWK